MTTITHNAHGRRTATLTDASGSAVIISETASNTLKLDRMELTRANIREVITVLEGYLQRGTLPYAGAGKAATTRKSAKKTYVEEDLRNLLRRNILKVVFKKTDGSYRTMYCTLEETLIPSDKRPTGTSTRKAAPGVISAFDLEIGNWRSFRVESLVKEPEMANGFVA